MNFLYHHKLGSSSDLIHHYTMYKDSINLVFFLVYVTRTRTIINVTHAKHQH